MFHRADCIRAITRSLCWPLLIALGACAATGQFPAGAERIVTFTDYAPLSSNQVLIQRSMSPLLAQHLTHVMARSGPSLTAQPINLADEHFSLYIPGRMPPGGYGLLVFVSPSPPAFVLPGWPAVLDQHGVIFVSAANSGNDQKVLSRREPLAVLAAINVVRRYHVDPARIYISGFSGGGRVALRLMLGYPDLFRGAILNAGSDPVGAGGLPQPAAPLFEQFQTSPIVYVTGAQDSFHLTADEDSIDSLHDWCAFNTPDLIRPNVGHAVMDGAALSQALRTLEHPSPPDQPKLTACRAKIAQQLDRDLAHIAALEARGEHQAAADALTKADATFGGLVPPSSFAVRPDHP